MTLVGHKTTNNLFENGIGNDDDKCSNKDEDLRGLGEGSIQNRVRVVEHEVEAKQKYKLKRNDEDDDEIRVYLYPFLFKIGQSKILPIYVVGIICMGELQHTAIVDKLMRISLVFI